MSKKVQIKVAVDVTNPTELEALNVFLRAIGQNPTITGNVQNIDRPAKDLKVVDAEVVKPTKEKPLYIHEPEGNIRKVEEPAEVQEAETPVETQASKYTREEVRSTTTEKAKINKEAVKAALTKLGANNVTSLDESKFDDFMAAIQSIK